MKPEGSMPHSQGPSNYLCSESNQPYSLLELIYYFTYFSTVVLSNSCAFLSCRPFVVNITFSTGLVGVEDCFMHRWEDFS